MQNLLCPNIYIQSADEFIHDAKPKNKEICKHY